MGSWNETCTLTGVTVGLGDEVKVVITLDNKVIESRAYTSAYTMSPISFVISGIYNDYGNIEAVTEDNATKLFIDYMDSLHSEGRISIKDKEQREKLKNATTYKEKLFLYLNMIERRYILIDNRQPRMHFIHKNAFDKAKLFIAQNYRSLTYNSRAKNFIEDIEKDLMSFNLKREDDPLIDFRSFSDAKKSFISILGHRIETPYFNKNASKFYYKKMFAENKEGFNDIKLFSDIIALLYMMKETKKTWGNVTGSSQHYNISAMIEMNNITTQAIQKLIEEQYIGETFTLENFITDTEGNQKGKLGEEYEIVKLNKDTNTLMIKQLTKRVLFITTTISEIDKHL